MVKETVSQISLDPAIGILSFKKSLVDRCTPNGENSEIDENYAQRSLTNDEISLSSATCRGFEPPPNVTLSPYYHKSYEGGKKKYSKLFPLQNLPQNGTGRHFGMLNDTASKHPSFPTSSPTSYSPYKMERLEFFRDRGGHSFDFTSTTTSNNNNDNSAGYFVHKRTNPIFFDRGAASMQNPIPDSNPTPTLLSISSRRSKQREWIKSSSSSFCTSIIPNVKSASFDNDMSLYCGQRRDSYRGLILAVSGKQGLGSRTKPIPNTSPYDSPFKGGTIKNRIAKMSLWRKSPATPHKYCSLQRQPLSRDLDRTASTGISVPDSGCPLVASAEDGNFGLAPSESHSLSVVGKAFPKPYFNTNFRDSQKDATNCHHPRASTVLHTPPLNGPANEGAVASASAPKLSVGGNRHNGTSPHSLNEHHPGMVKTPRHTCNTGGGDMVPATIPKDSSRLNGIITVVSGQNNYPSPNLYVDGEDRAYLYPERTTGKNGVAPTLNGAFFEDATKNECTRVSSHNYSRFPKSPKFPKDDLHLDEFKKHLLNSEGQVTEAKKVYSRPHSYHFGSDTVGAYIPPIPKRAQETLPEGMSHDSIRKNAITNPYHTRFSSNIENNIDISNGDNSIKRSQIIPIMGSCALIKKLGQGPSYNRDDPRFYNKFRSEVDIQQSLSGNNSVIKKQISLNQESPLPLAIRPPLPTNALRDICYDEGGTVIGYGEGACDTFDVSRIRSIKAGLGAPWFGNCRRSNYNHLRSYSDDVSGELPRFRPNYSTFRDVLSFDHHHPGHHNLPTFTQGHWDGCINEGGLGRDNLQQGCTQLWNHPNPNSSNTHEIINPKASCAELDYKGSPPFSYPIQSNPKNIHNYNGGDVQGNVDALYHRNKLTISNDIKLETKSPNEKKSEPITIGPEFILKSIKEPIPFTLTDVDSDEVKSMNKIRGSGNGNIEDYICFPHKNKNRFGDAKKVLVILLDGQTLEISCNLSTFVKEILNLIFEYTAIKEPDYFTLSYIKESEHILLEPDEKLSKISPPAWKEDKDKHILPLTFNLFLRVKFYVDDIHILTDVVTIHQYYLQVRKDILEQRLVCTDVEAFSLASFALQAEFGDYCLTSLGENYYIIEHYMPRRMIIKYGIKSIKERLNDMHQKLTGLTRDNAELSFLREAQTLKEFGIHFYKLFRCRQKSFVPMHIGIGISGITILESNDIEPENRIPLSIIPWNNVDKISFDQNRFKIQKKIFPKSLGTMNNKLLSREEFYTENSKKGRYLLRLSEMHHKFNIQLKARKQFSDIYAQRSPARFQDYCLYSSLNDKISKSIPTSTPETCQKLSPSMYTISEGCQEGANSIDPIPRANLDTMEIRNRQSIIQNINQQSSSCSKCHRVNIDCRTPNQSAMCRPALIKDYPQGSQIVPQTTTYHRARNARDDFAYDQEANPCCSSPNNTANSANEYYVCSTIEREGKQSSGYGSQRSNCSLDLNCVDEYQSHDRCCLIHRDGQPYNNFQKIPEQRHDVVDKIFPPGENKNRSHNQPDNPNIKLGEIVSNADETISKDFKKILKFILKEYHRMTVEQNSKPKSAKNLEYIISEDDNSDKIVESAPQLSLNNKLSQSNPLPNTIPIITLNEQGSSTAQHSIICNPQAQDNWNGVEELKDPEVHEDPYPIISYSANKLQTIISEFYSSESMKPLLDDSCCEEQKNMLFEFIKYNLEKEHGRYCEDGASYIPTYEECHRDPKTNYEHESSQCPIAIQDTRDISSRLSSESPISPNDIQVYDLKYPYQSGTNSHSENTSSLRIKEAFQFLEDLPNSVTDNYSDENVCSATKGTSVTPTDCHLTNNPIYPNNLPAHPNFSKFHRAPINNPRILKSSFGREKIIFYREPASNYTDRSGHFKGSLDQDVTIDECNPPMTCANNEANNRKARTGLTKFPLSKSLNIGNGTFTDSHIPIESDESRLVDNLGRLKDVVDEPSCSNVTLTKSGEIDC